MCSIFHENVLGRPTARSERNGLEGNGEHRERKARGKSRDALGQGIGISIEHSFKYLKAITNGVL